MVGVASFGAVGWKMALFAVEVAMVIVVAQELIAAVEATLTVLCFRLVFPFVPEKECC